MFHQYVIKVVFLMKLFIYKILNNNMTQTLQNLTFRIRDHVRPVFESNDPVSLYNLKNVSQLSRIFKYLTVAFIPY